MDRLSRDNEELILLDEPWSKLDAKLRESLQRALGRVEREWRSTSYARYDHRGIKVDV